MSCTTSNSSHLLSLPGAIIVATLENFDQSVGMQNLGFGFSSTVRSLILTAYDFHDQNMIQVYQGQTQISDQESDEAIISRFQNLVGLDDGTCQVTHFSTDVNSTPYLCLSKSSAIFGSRITLNVLKNLTSFDHGMVQNMTIDLIQQRLKPTTILPIEVLQTYYSKGCQTYDWWNEHMLAIEARDLQECSAEAAQQHIQDLQRQLTEYHDANLQSDVEIEAMLDTLRNPVPPMYAATNMPLLQPNLDVAVVPLDLPNADPLNVVPLLLPNALNVVPLPLPNLDDDGVVDSPASYVSDDTLSSYQSEDPLEPFTPDFMKEYNNFSA